MSPLRKRARRSPSRPVREGARALLALALYASTWLACGGTVLNDELSGSDAAATGDHTVVPDAARTLDATLGPDATPGPDATTGPDATRDPDATPGPDATRDPDATRSPDATTGPDARRPRDGATDATMTADVLAAMDASIDAPPCGALDQPCCADFGCNAQLTCTSGTCETHDGPVAVLFGIFTPPNTPSQTWTWNGADWTRLLVDEPPESPPDPPYVDSLFGVMVPLGGELVLVGSTYYEPDNPLETWIWDGSTWTRMDVTGPPERQSFMLAPLDGKLVLFGGFAGFSADGGTLDLGDTWTWDGTAWTQLDVLGPPARSNAGFAPVGGKLVLFGGQGETEQLADTWVWDGAAWTQLDVPGPPAQQVTAASANGKMYVIDSNSTEPRIPVWSFDGTSWTETIPPAHPVIDAGGYCHGPATGFEGQVLLVCGDTWTWDGSAWTDHGATAPHVVEGASTIAVP